MILLPIDLFGFLLGLVGILIGDFVVTIVLLQWFKKEEKDRRRAKHV